MKIFKLSIPFILFLAGLMGVKAQQAVEVPKKSDNLRQANKAPITGYPDTLVTKLCQSNSQMARNLIKDLRLNADSLTKKLFVKKLTYYHQFYKKHLSFTKTVKQLQKFYKPIFKAQKRNNKAFLTLPNDLFTIAIIETGLDAQAKSKAGAAGLWQIMPSSAKLLGISNQERFDVFKSTRAIIESLYWLTSYYNVDYKRIIIAYNYGSGRLDKLLKSNINKEKDEFWAMYRYLPQESQNYLACFVIAADVFGSEHKPHYQESIQEEYTSNKLGSKEDIVRLLKVNSQIPPDTFKLLNAHLSTKAFDEKKKDSLIVYSKKGWKVCLGSFNSVSPGVVEKKDGKRDLKIINKQVGQRAVKKEFKSTSKKSTPITLASLFILIVLFILAIRWKNVTSQKKKHKK